MKNNIRNELKEYASTVSENCRRFAHEMEKLAYFIEDLYTYKERYDLSIDGMDKKYNWQGELYKLIEEQKKWIVVASGAVPVDNRIKKELRLFEYAKSKFRDVFNSLSYCDELWFFTTNTLAVGWVEYSYIAENLPEKIDLTQLYPSGMTRFSWFAIADPINNPRKKGTWSPFPFVELYNQWVFSYHYPVYVDEKFKGVVTPHAKIEYILEDSIYKSNEKMLVIHDDSTLVGMNAAAEKEFKIENYHYHLWDDNPKKISYVRNDLNMLNNKSQGIILLADGIKWQNEFELTINGHDYVVLKERIPEINCSIVACAEKA